MTTVSNIATLRLSGDPREEERLETVLSILTKMAMQLVDEEKTSKDPPAKEGARTDGE